MAVLKEFFCKAHGRFEAVADDNVPPCPYGCTTVERRFFTPQGISTSGKTKFVDQTMSELAARFGFGDMSNRNGESVVHNQLAQAKVSEAFKPQWHAMPKSDAGVNVGEFMKSHGVNAGADPGALAPGQFQRPQVIADPRLTYKDSAVTAAMSAAVAEGRKANAQ